MYFILYRSLFVSVIIKIIFIQLNGISVSHKMSNSDNDLRRDAISRGRSKGNKTEAKPREEGTITVAHPALRRYDYEERWIGRYGDSPSLSFALSFTSPRSN